jgi:hypothetical protein
MRAAVCIVGHLRTFGLATVWTSLTFKNADTRGTVFTSERAFNSHPHATCDASRALKAFALEVFPESDCPTYTRVSGISRCTPDVAWLQHAWVQRCFRTFPSRQHKLYVRIRPDVFFASGRRSTWLAIAEDTRPLMVTTEKDDAPQSDHMFFLNAAGLHAYLDNPLPRGCCSDYHRWLNLTVMQDSSLASCVVRNRRTLQCWKSDARGVVDAFAKGVARNDCSHRCNDDRELVCRRCVTVLSAC